MPERRAYLLDVTDRCPNERLMQELVDVLARYSYNEFFVFSARDRTAASPADEPTGENGTFLSRRVRAYCEIQGIDFAEIGPDGYDALLLDGKTVCVPTFAARSLCGRIEEMRHAMEQGEQTVRARKAKRFLVLVKGSIVASLSIRRKRRYMTISRNKEMRIVTACMVQ